MADPIELEEKRSAERRLALLALAGTQPEACGSCLEAETLACLVEGRLAPEQIEPCLTHLAGCEHCYAAWCHLDQEWQERTQHPGRKKMLQLLKRPRFLATAGTLLAAAASIAVFLTITLQADRRAMTRLPAQPAREQILSAPASQASSNQALREKGVTAPAPPAAISPNLKEEPTTGQVVQQVEGEKNRASVRDDLNQSGKRETSTPAPAAKAEPATADTMPQQSRQDVARPDEAGQATAGAPPRSKQAASPPLSGVVGASPLTLEDWLHQIRMGCQEQPGADFFTAVADQGQQLLAAPSLHNPERRQVRQILALLAEQHPSDQQCRMLLDLLGPVPPKKR